jgi:hypothetical protein
MQEGAPSISPSEPEKDISGIENNIKTTRESLEKEQERLNNAPEALKISIMNNIRRLQEKLGDLENQLNA